MPSRRFVLIAALLSAALTATPRVHSEEAPRDRRACLDRVAAGRAGEAIAVCRAAVGRGDAAAAAALGALAERGEGMAADLAEARRLYRIAANGGDAAGSSALAAMLRSGRGGPADPGDARRLLTAAAAAGSSRARSDLGLMLLDGEGGPADPGEAERLLRLAAADGLADGRNNLAWLLAGQRRALDEALELARAAIAADPGVPEYHHTLATVLTARGDLVAAAEEAGVTVSLSPVPENLILHGRLMLLLGDPEEALLSLSLAIERLPPGPLRTDAERLADRAEAAIRDRDDAEGAAPTAAPGGPSEESGASPPGEDAL